MLAASIHEHAGLGNQIWRYVCCRVFAENLGYEWGVSNPGWRGPFLNIDWGKDVDLNKNTYVNLLGLSGAKEELNQVLQKCEQDLTSLGELQPEMDLMILEGFLTYLKYSFAKYSSVIFHESFVAPPI